VAVSDHLLLGRQRMYPTTQNSRIFDAAPREGGIHIALADDYPVLLAGMRQSLAPCDDIVVVAECTRFSDLLSEVSLNKPEVILLGCDSNLENLSHQLHSIAELHADVKVIVFTGNVNVNFHEAALRNGAKGILLKQCSPEWIAKTVRKVSQGDLCFDPALTHRVLSTSCNANQLNFQRQRLGSHRLPGGRIRSSARYARACATRKLPATCTLAMPRWPIILRPSTASWVSPTALNFSCTLTTMVSRP